ncbi:hypothetical protein Scep_024071 [Stephania cephalantha]|uniref:Uncharacterized protein n=1 Tax=Stephania cephalantha TaxID=152367 RepID=A0AAP0EVV9_9MAGN
MRAGTVVGRCCWWRCSRCTGQYGIYLFDIIEFFYNWVMKGSSDNKGKGILYDFL